MTQVHPQVRSTAGCTARFTVGVTAAFTAGLSAGVAGGLTAGVTVARKITASTALALALSTAAAHATTIDVLAKTGDVAPGTGGATYEFFGAPGFSSDGGFGFQGSIQGASVTRNDNGVTFNAGTLVAREGDVAPDSGAATFRSLSSSTFNEAGEVAFLGSLQGTGITGTNNQGLFTGDGLLIAEGAEAPGSGGDLYSLFFGGIDMNASGEIAFEARLRDSTTGQATADGIFTTAAGLVALEGYVAPGTNAATYDSFQGPTINDTGEVAFRANLTGGDTTNDNDSAIFAAGALVARQGDVAPDTGGATFDQFGPTAAINNAGDVAFVAELEGPGALSNQDEGLFTSAGLVARAGDVAPRTGGATFSTFESIAFNTQGDLAFWASLEGANITSENLFGLFVEDSRMGMRQILQSGDVLDLGNGDLRTVDYFSFDVQGLNERGDVLFVAGFTDGSEAILSAPVPLPPAVAMMLAGLGSLAFVARRRVGARRDA